VTTTLVGYQLISNRMDTWLKSVAAQPSVAVASAAYLDRIEQITSIDDFLKDDRVFQYAMKAFGLEDMSYAKAFMRKVLEEGVDSSDAFANQLADTRYREFADTFNFKRYGETATIFDKTRQGTVDRYVRQSVEEAAGAQNENVRLALYFERKASRIEGPFDILADQALTKVAFTALGLPSSTSLMNIDAQAQLLSSRIDFADFQSPDQTGRFISRFAALADAQSGASTSGSLSLLTGAAGTMGLGVDLLLAVQSVRRG
jgi:Protein of unknown function (DUF1217)